MSRLDRTQSRDSLVTSDDDCGHREWAVLSFRDD